MSMYMPIEPQPDCVSAWREATKTVEGQKGHHASNVIIGVENPLLRASLADPAVEAVDAFLRSKGKKGVDTVANTLFPAGLYRRHGAPKFYQRFEENVLPVVGKSDRWSGYYFERMIRLPNGQGKPVNQLADIVARIKNPNVRARNKFELQIFDPIRDVDNSPYGGQCLSFASFKLRKENGVDVLDLTAMYRNHFYIEKLLGNIIGLGQLMDFIAKEGRVTVGAMTLVSTHAQVDRPDSTSTAEIAALLEACA
jgi:thymidylate synthase